MANINRPFGNYKGSLVDQMKAGASEPSRREQKKGSVKDAFNRGFNGAQAGQGNAGKKKKKKKKSGGGGGGPFQGAGLIPR